MPGFLLFGHLPVCGEDELKSAPTLQQGVPFQGPQHPAGERVNLPSSGVQC